MTVTKNNKKVTKYAQTINSIILHVAKSKDGPIKIKDSPTNCVLLNKPVAKQ